MTTYVVQNRNIKRTLSGVTMLENNDRFTADEKSATLPFDPKPLAREPGPGPSVYKNSLYTLTLVPDSDQGSTLKGHPGSGDDDSVETFTATPDPDVEELAGCLPALLQKAIRALRR